MWLPPILVDKRTWYGSAYSSRSDTPTDKETKYFTSLSLKIFNLDVGRGPAVLPNAVWRFTPETHSLTPVIPRADVFSPNGVAVNRDFTQLYVTDSVVRTRNAS